MRKLQIDECVFGLELDLDYKRRPYIIGDPIRSGQRFIRSIRGAPEKFRRFALDFRGIDLKDLVIVSSN